MTISFTHHTKLQKSASTVWSCTKTVNQEKSSPIMSPRLGCLTKFPQLIPLKSLWLPSKNLLLLVLVYLSGITKSLEAVPPVPSVPNVSKVKKIPSFFSGIPKKYVSPAPLAPKASFAPRPIRAVLAPKVKRPKTVRRVKPARLIPLVRRTSLIPRVPYVRNVPKRRF